MTEKKPLWNPYIVGIGLGLVLLADFVVTGKGLGASGAMDRIMAWLLHGINPTWAEANGNIGHFFNPAHAGPLDGWVVPVVIGVALGGFVGAYTGGRLKVETLHGPRIRSDVRWLLALIGGAFCGFGAQMARGCTSGQGMTGGAQLALGSWVFLFAVFGGAGALAYFVRKQWI